MLHQKSASAHIAHFRREDINITYSCSTNKPSSNCQPEVACLKPSAWECTRRWAAPQLSSFPAACASCILPALAQGHILASSALPELGEAGSG